jgi:hypothetical protein
MGEASPPGGRSAGFLGGHRRKEEAVKGGMVEAMSSSLPLPLGILPGGIVVVPSGAGDSPPCWPAWPASKTADSPSTGHIDWELG